MRKFHKKKRRIDETLRELSFFGYFRLFLFRFVEWPSPKKPSWAGGCFLSTKKVDAPKIAIVILTKTSGCINFLVFGGVAPRASSQIQGSDPMVAHAGPTPQIQKVDSLKLDGPPNETFDFYTLIILSDVEC